MHDPLVYENPEEFKPERFLKDGKLDPNVRDPYEFVFGFGRRRVFSTLLYMQLRSIANSNDFPLKQSLPWAPFCRCSPIYQYRFSSSCFQHNPAVG